MAQFRRVQDILRGRVGTRVYVHDFLFRRTIKCGHCGRSLIGERQKGIVYYRCHRPTCKRVIVRETAFDSALADQLKSIGFTTGERRQLKDRLGTLKSSWANDRDATIQAARMRIDNVTARLNRLTDAYLDQVLDKAMFEARKETLIAESRSLEDKIRDYDTNRLSIPEEIEKCVELAESAYSLYQDASVEKKRRLVRILMSNCTIRDRNLDFTWQMPFREIAAREKTSDGAPSKEMGRTISALFDRLISAFREGPISEIGEIEDAFS